jgi:hypothetical protein
MNDPLPDQASAQEVAATPPQSAAVARAKELADIAAQSAKFAGIDVTITPCPEVFIQVDGARKPIRGLGVQFDDEYLLVLHPTNGWQALKIDPATRSVVLQLFGRRGYRAHVVRILTCLIFDRLRNERDRFEPRIAVLCQPEAPVRLTSVPEPPVYPFPDRKPKRTPAPSPPPAAEVPPPAAPHPDPIPATDPDGPARAGSAPSTEPAAPATPGTPLKPAKPAKPARPQATTGGKSRPLTGQGRR